MPLADTYVRARINGRMKRKAETALAALGLTVSDAIRLTLTRIAEEKRLPFDIQTPTPATKSAAAELRRGKGKKFASVSSLMADLDADD